MAQQGRQRLFVMQSVRQQLLGNISVEKKSFSFTDKY